MQLDEIERQAARAREENKKFILVCYDRFDRLKGDVDGGYYYSTLDNAKEVSARLAIMELDDGDPAGIRDVCEAVVELTSKTSMTIDFSSVWIRRRKGD